MHKSESWNVDITWFLKPKIAQKAHFFLGLDPTWGAYSAPSCPPADRWGTPSLGHLGHVSQSCVARLPQSLIEMTALCWVINWSSSTMREHDGDMSLVLCMGRGSDGGRSGGAWPPSSTSGGHPCYWPLLENAKSASSLATVLGHDWKLWKLLPPNIRF